MTGIHTGAVVAFDGNRSATPVMPIAGSSTGVHTGGIYDFGDGRYARPVVVLDQNGDPIDVLEHSVLSYGATGDGSTDDTAALQAAVAGAGAFGYVYLPPGTYAYTTLAINLNGVQLVGAGMGATFLEHTGAADGITVNVAQGSQISNVGIRNLTLGAATDRTAGAALRLGYVGRFRGENIFITNALGGRPYEGLRIDRASDARFSSLLVAGCAAHGAILQPGGTFTTVGATGQSALVASTDGVIVEIYFDELCEFRSNLGDGLCVFMDRAYTASVSSVEGLHTGAMHYNNAKAGARIRGAVTGSSPRNLHFNGASFDSNTGTSSSAGSVDGGLVVEGFDATWPARRIYVGFSGGWSSFNSASGIHFNRVREWGITGSAVRGNGLHGLDIQNSDRGVIKLGLIVDNSRNADNTSYGLQIGGASTNIVVEASFENTDDQTNDQRGVNIGSTATDIDLSRTSFRTQEVGTVANINGGDAAGNTSLKAPTDNAVSTRTGAYTVTGDIDFVPCNTTSAGFTVTLPRAANWPGRRITVKRTSGANTVTIAATAGSVETTSATTTAIAHISDGTNWVAV